MSRFFVHPDISQAQTLSKDLYLSEDLFEEAKEQVFSSSWQFCGDTDVLQQPGTLQPFVFLDPYLPEPLMWSKNREGALHCLSNVCTHRGNILLHEACQAHHIQCRYHGRRFDMDGKFSFMPEFREVKSFPAPGDDLHSLPFHLWGKWLFAALSLQLPAEAYLGDMMKRMAWLPFEKFKFRADLSKDYEVEAHWALYCENYLEGFHIPFIHGGLNEAIDYGTYTTELFPLSSLQLGLAKEGELVFDLPAESPDFGKRVAGYYFWIFPNLMFNFYPWGLSVNIVRPVTRQRTKISFLTYVMDEEKFGQGAGGDLYRVEMEDEEVVQAVQRGIQSRFYAHGRYSVTREQGVHHFHRLLAESFG